MLLTTSFFIFFFRTRNEQNASKCPKLHLVFRSALFPNQQWRNQQKLSKFYWNHLSYNMALYFRSNYYIYSTFVFDIQNLETNQLEKGNYNKSILIILISCGKINIWHRNLSHNLCINILFILFIFRIWLRSVMTICVEVYTRLNMQEGRGKLEKRCLRRFPMGGSGFWSPKSWKLGKLGVLIVWVS